jgi:hypothetical protein
MKYGDGWQGKTLAVQKSQRYKKRLEHRLGGVKFNIIEFDSLTVLVGVQGQMRAAPTF